MCQYDNWIRLVLLQNVEMLHSCGDGFWVWPGEILCNPYTTYIDIMTLAAVLMILAPCVMLRRVLCFILSWYRQLCVCLVCRCRCRWLFGCHPLSRCCRAVFIRCRLRPVSTWLRHRHQQSSHRSLHFSLATACICTAATVIKLHNISSVLTFVRVCSYGWWSVRGFW